MLLLFCMEFKSYQNLFSFHYTCTFTFVDLNNAGSELYLIHYTCLCAVIDNSIRNVLAGRYVEQNPWTELTCTNALTNVV